MKICSFYCGILFSLTELLASFKAIVFLDKIKIEELGTCHSLFGIFFQNTENEFLELLRDFLPGREYNIIRCLYQWYLYNFVEIALFINLKRWSS